MSLPFTQASLGGLLFAVAIGFAFGFALERAGLGCARKLTAQFYGDDLTVLKVMSGAIATATAGLTVLSFLGLVEFEELALAAATETFLVPMMVGGFLLGAGFVIAGYCPGTSVVAAASGKLDGLLAVMGVAAGQLLWAELQDLPGFSAFHQAGALGHLFLWDLWRPR